MEFSSSAPSWDPLGMPPSPSDMERELAAAEQAMQPGMPPPKPDRRGYALLIIGVLLFPISSVLPGFVAVFTRDIGLTAFLGFFSWVFGLPFILIGVWMISKELTKRQAAERLLKMTFARKHGWVVTIGKNRYRELKAAFPAFMAVPGSGARICEEWWGTMGTDDRKQPVWLAQLAYQVSSGKHSRTECATVVGIRARSSAAASVTLSPEHLGHKFLHLFRGEYKTGNAEFDAAFNISTGAAQQSSSMVPAVLTPPFIAAVMRYAKPRRATVHRERDMLLVRFPENDMLPLPASQEQGAPPPDDAWSAKLSSLVEPVVELAAQSGI